MNEILNFVKKYINITTNEYDNFLISIINSFFGLHTYLLKKPRKIFARLYPSQYGSSLFSSLRPLPTTFQRVYIGNSFDTLFEIPTSQVSFNPSTGFFHIQNQGIYSILVFECERGYQLSDIPVSIQMEIAKYATIEFKQSFQGEGGLIYSGRTIGDTSFNFYQNFRETTMEIHRKIQMKFRGWDEIEEVEI